MRVRLRVTRGDRMAALVVVLIGAVFVTAILQLRWLDRLAESESRMLERMVQTQAARLSDTLTHDLARMVAFFSASEEPIDWNARIAIWNSTPDIPAAIRSVYRVRLQDGDAGLSLIGGLAVDDERARLLLRRIIEPIQSAPESNRSGALVLSLFDWESTTLRLRESGDDRSWIVLALDRPSFREPYLSRLVERFLPPESSFDVAITRPPGRVVFTSTITDIRVAPDAIVGLFDPVLTAEWKEASVMPLRPRAFRHVAGTADPVWTMFIRHRAGSIGKAVAETRRKGAVISGFTLLLLMTSGIALVFSARSTRIMATERSMFASMVTHELLTPLAVIGAASETLSEGRVREAGRVSHYGNIIRDETRRLTGLISEVLDLAKGIGPIRRTQVDLAALARATAERFRAAGAQRIIVLPAAPSIEAFVDAGHLRAG